MNCLKDAVLNEEVFVVDIEHTALMKRRLMDLGFVPRQQFIQIDDDRNTVIVVQRKTRI